LLQRRHLTAFVFIAVSVVERGIMWNDLVIEALRRAPRWDRASELFRYLAAACRRG
jgi:hypothetical protein